MRFGVLKILALAFTCLTVILTASSASAAIATNAVSSAKAVKPLQVEIKIKGEALSYALINSEEDENLWYYASLSPKLYEYRVSNKAPLEPALTLIRFQKLDPKNPRKMLEGALFECSFVIDSNKKVERALRTKLPRDVNKRLARFLPLPLTGFELELVRPNEKTNIFITAEEAQSYSNEAEIRLARFATTLSATDALLLSTLLTEKTGVYYRLNLKYNQYSKPEKLGVSLNLGGTREKLFNDDDLKKLDPQFVKQIIGRTKNPRILSGLKAQATKADASSNAKASSQSLDEKEVFDVRTVGRKKINVGIGLTKKSTTELIQAVEFVYKTREERLIAAEGLLTLSNYSQNIIKEKVYTEANFDEWGTAYLMLPSINTGAAMQVKEVTLDISLRDRQFSYEKMQFTWSESLGWRTKEGAPVAIARFNLKDLQARASKNPLSEAYFRVDSKIGFMRDPAMSTSLTLPVLNGDIPITTPFTVINVLSFDFINLFWDALSTNAGRLTKIELSIKDDKRSIRRTVEPYKQDDRVIYPEMLYVATGLDSYDEGRVRASLYFHTANGKRVPWEFNGLKLNEYFDLPYFMFFDEDWKS